MCIAIFSPFCPYSMHINCYCLFCVCLCVQRMKQMPRQVDLNFADLANRFKEKHREREERIVKEL